MESLGAVPLVMLVVLVVLALDSRRLHALARSKVRDRRETKGGIPPGANPDQVGLPLRQIQMRIHVDWEDGGVGWEGPEILPADEVDEAHFSEFSDATDVVDVSPEAQTSETMPVLWRPFPALPAGGQSGAAGVLPSPA